MGYIVKFRGAGRDREGERKGRNKREIANGDRLEEISNLGFSHRQSQTKQVTTEGSRVVPRTVPHRQVTYNHLRRKDLEKSFETPGDVTCVGDLFPGYLQ